MVRCVGRCSVGLSNLPSSLAEKLVVDLAGVRSERAERGEEKVPSDDLRSREGELPREISESETTSDRERETLDGEKYMDRALLDTEMRDFALPEVNFLCASMVFRSLSLSRCQIPKKSRTTRISRSSLTRVGTSSPRRASTMAWNSRPLCATVASLARKMDAFLVSFGMYS